MRGGAPRFSRRQAGDRPIGHPPGCPDNSLCDTTHGPTEATMASTQVSSVRPTEIPTAGKVEMKLEVVVLPVSDVDRAKRFYGGLGWRLDADFTTGEDFRVVQLTP